MATEDFDVAEPGDKTCAVNNFALSGINHLALVCSDMARTVDFYENTLGMPLIKTVELPVDMGQHFFFDCGNGDALAFFWFAKAPAAAPGISSPAARPDTGDTVTAHASMNHVAFSVPPDAIDGYVEKLRQAGVECSDVVNHDDSEWGVSHDQHPGVFVRSIYFTDPDGILLEFAAWQRELGPDDVAHTPVSPNNSKD
ncbi:MAG: VOC family protein [Acidobacteria bacterium]|nr:VOC family protein [Acidobacteriota bacterium]